MERKIYWKSTYGLFPKEYFGIVYKCPKSTFEEHDLRISTIEECQKCYKFNGFKLNGWKKLVFIVSMKIDV